MLHSQLSGLEPFHLNGTRSDSGSVSRRNLIATTTMTLNDTPHTAQGRRSEIWASRAPMSGQMIMLMEETISMRLLATAYAAGSPLNMSASALLTGNERSASAAGEGQSRRGTLTPLRRCATASRRRA